MQPANYDIHVLFTVDDTNDGDGTAGAFSVLTQPLLQLLESSPFSGAGVE